MSSVNPSLLSCLQPDLAFTLSSVAVSVLRPRITIGMTDSLCVAQLSDQPSIQWPQEKSQPGAGPECCRIISLLVLSDLRRHLAPRNHTQGMLDILSSVNPTMTHIPAIFSHHPKSQPHGRLFPFLLWESSCLTQPHMPFFS